MELTVNQQDLLRASGRTHSIVESKTIHFANRCVSLQASGSMLELRTATGAREIKETIPVQVNEPGSALVESSVLNQILRRLPRDSEVRLSTEGGDRPDAESGESGDDWDPYGARKLLIRAGESSFHLSLADPALFPKASDPEYPVSFPFGGAELRMLLSKTAKFMPDDIDARDYLKGVYFHPVDEDGQPFMVAVATDTHCLSRVMMPVDEQAEGFEGIIIPADTVAVLRSCVADEDDLTLSVASNRFRVAGPNYIIVSSLVGANYPNYQHVIPVDRDRTMEFERNALVSCIKRVTAVASDKERIYFRVEDGTATLRINAQSGQAEDQIAVIDSGPLVEFILLDRHLLDVLAQIEGDAVDLRKMRMRDGRETYTVNEKVGRMSLTCVLMPHKA